MVQRRKLLKGERETWLQFSKDDNRIHGSGGCNRFFCSYELEGNSLRFGKIGATRMSCAMASAQEDAFFIMLNEATRYRLTEHQLELFSNDRPVARFEAVSVQ
jgi:heat shock protein HslJ